MQPNKFLALVLGLLIGGTCWADGISRVQSKKSPELDLLKESDTLEVLSEKPVQEKMPEGRFVLNFGVGEMTAQRLTLTSNGETINYDLGQNTPFLDAELGYFPARFAGYWGVMTSIGYSYRQQLDQVSASALHLLTTDALFTYRYEQDTRSWWKPYFGIGPGINIAIQRGAVDQVNTSEAHGLAVTALGVGFNVKRLFNMQSPLDWEVTAQYKRWIDPSVSNANYNGQLIRVGLAMAL